MSTDRGGELSRKLHSIPAVSRDEDVRFCIDDGGAHLARPVVIELIKEMRVVQIGCWGVDKHSVTHTWEVLT